MTLRVLRYEMRMILPATMAILLVFGVGTLAATAVTGRAEGIFYTYYRMYPALGLFVVFIYGTSNTSNFVNTALSMGVTRREFFGAVQLLILLTTVLVEAVAVLVVLVPNWAGLHWIEPPLSLRALPTLAVLSILCQEMAGAMGFLAGKSRWLMGLVVALAALLLGVVTFLFMMATHTGSAVWSGWGSAVLAGLLAAALALGGLFWLLLSKHVVR